MVVGNRRRHRLVWRRTEDHRHLALYSHPVRLTLSRPWAPTRGPGPRCDLPPLVRHPDGSVHRLDRGTHHLIGALAPGHSPRGEAAVSLPPGSLLLLYTDGLVETRLRHFDEGIDTLCTALTDQDPTHPLDQTCDGLIQELADRDPQDDVALQAIRVDGP